MRVSKLSRIEKALERDEILRICRKNIENHFMEMGRNHLPWLHRLMKKYKKRGDFGILPCVLADFYTSPSDKETALLASMIISEKGEIMVQARHIRKLMGDSPSEWYENREFVSLALGKNILRHRIKGYGAPEWALAELMGRLWEIEHPGGRRTRLRDELLLLSRQDGMTLCEALDYMLSGVDLGSNRQWRISMMLTCLFRRDGIGSGLWGKGKEYVECPWDRHTEAFLKLWFPDYSRYGDRRDCIALFGFKNETDFLYAVWAYEELKRAAPVACRVYSTKYYAWYTQWGNVDNYLWRKVQPRIKFKD